jgi:hypothetical protein
MSPMIFYARFPFVNNQTERLRILDSTNQTSYYSMGVDIADINNDALLDILW